jgi:hypothetical protein
MVTGWYDKMNRVFFMKASFALIAAPPVTKTGRPAAVFADHTIKKFDLRRGDSSAQIFRKLNLQTHSTTVLVKTDKQGEYYDDYSQ